ncbi:hypothetical protein GCM10027037_09570 [Mucilaginibacter koreensis]
MKKILLSAFITLAAAASASAQLLPSFQFGAKAGVNLTHLSASGFSNFNSENRAGFLAGFWARIGGAGIHFQPELYYASKNANVSAAATATTANGSGTVTAVTLAKANFRSIDLPLLVGTKFGVLGNGVRLNTGPVISFVIDKDNSFKNALGSATNFDAKGQNYAWQFGVGADIRRVSLDLRYEAGISKVTNDDNYKTRINLFNFTLGYRLFSL